MKSILFLLFKILVFLTLPFIFLIRGAVFLHDHYLASPWFAILGGALVTVFLLVIYMTVIYGHLTGSAGNGTSFKRRAIFAFIIVIGYALYGLLFISNNNAKHTEVQREFTSLHPILRLSISTILFLDKELIITDAQRKPEDYKRMGLKSKKRSLHYRQSDGYAHAVDIRTNGRSAVRNFLLRIYFGGMGLNTLRHVGTDDHLHISLSSRDSPGAI